MKSDALIKQGWLRAVIGLIVFYPVIDNSIYILRLLTKIIDFTPNRLCIATNTLIIALLAVYLVRRFIDRKSFVSLGFYIKGFARDLLYGFVGSFVIMGTGFLILFLKGNIEVTAINPNFVSLLYWATTLLFAAALEELTFRGYMLSNLTASMNKYIALGITSVLFGLGHAAGQNVSVIGMVNCVLLGVLVGLYYIHKRNLWMPIAFHLGWNFFQGTIFGFNVSGRAFDYSLLSTEITGNDLVTGGRNGFEGSLILTFLTILTIILLGMHLRRRNVEIPGRTEDAPG